uniref:Exostosin GT47 domain-containing protein n=1 Tax=Fibrocapsa japonica TaxID=94617 RepID=A0A7S2V4F6_9STRA
MDRFYSAAKRLVISSFCFKCALVGLVLFCLVTFAMELMMTEDLFQMESIGRNIDDPFQLIYDKSAQHLSTSQLRIYVYDVPTAFTTDLLESAKLSNNTFDWPAWRQMHAMEVVIHQAMVNLPEASDHQARAASAVRTLDPEDAALFFVPFYASLAPSWDLTLYSGLVAHLRQFGRYWDRYGGADHILVAASKNTLRSAYKTRAKHLMVQNPIFLTPEMMNYNPDWLKRNFFKLQKNVIIPYFSTIPWEPTAQSAPGPGLGRKYLASFHGSVDTAVDAQVRRSLAKAMAAREDCHVSAVTAKHRAEVSVEEIVEAMAASTFCPCPTGDSRASKRLADSVHLGCIPVITDPLLLLPFEGRIDWRRAAVFVDLSSRGGRRHHARTVYDKLLQILSSMNHNQTQLKQQYLKTISPMLQYNTTVSPNAIKMILDALDSRYRLLQEKIRAAEYYSHQYNTWDHLYYRVFNIITG